MLEREREEEFVGWLRGKLGGLQASEAEAAAGAEVLPGLRITAMREAGGVDYREAEAQTVAMQLEFGSADEARRWSAANFGAIAAAFEEQFGPQALVFTSIFEVI